MPPSHSLSPEPTAADGQTATAPHFDSIPIDLEVLDQWGGYRREGDDHPPKQTRSPRRNLSKTTPEQFAGFAETRAVVEAGEMDGLAFVLTEGDPFFFADLDGCFIDGELHPSAREIVERTNAYTEISKSGEGLHILGAARIGSGSSAKGKLGHAVPWARDGVNTELAIYDRKAIVYVTGHVFEGHSQIRECQLEAESIKLLVDRYRRKEEPATAAPPGIPNDRLDDLVRELDAWENGDHHRARCPAHNGESTNSLSIKTGDKGNLLLFCHPGCEYGDVLRVCRERLGLPAEPGAPSEGEVEEGSKKAPSQATQLVELAEGIELFHSPGSEAEAFARIAVADRLETWPLRARVFKDWLRRLFYTEVGNVPGSQAVTDALGVLEGKALFDGRELPVHVRLGEHGGNFFLDLANESWEVVRITASGWEVVADSPARFRRPKGVEPLPRPVQGGSVADLRPLVNAQDDDWVLYVAWMIGALNPHGPFTLLDILGEQGSGKTDGSKIARRTIDPNLADLRGRPRNSHDLAIAADNGWIVGYDNLSSIPDWFSDDLAKLATGGGFGTRTLYENREEEIFEAKRPIILNGITEVISRPDLLDRALVLEFLPILDGRVPERELWAGFEAVRPRVLGALLDAVAAAIKGLPDVDLQDLPRMADFAEWVVAASPSLGWEPNRFLDAYTTNRTAADETTLAASPLYGPLVKLGDFKGTASELLAALTELISEQEARRKEWPKAAHVLGGDLRRIAPNLRRVGIEVEFDVAGQRRGIRITHHKIEAASERPERPSVRSGTDSDASDASDGRLQAESSDGQPASPEEEELIEQYLEDTNRADTAQPPASIEATTREAHSE